jgi:hypothetical protein
MPKLTAIGFEPIGTGSYVLEILDAQPVNVYAPQLFLRLRVAEGEHQGFELQDYAECGVANGVQRGSKVWSIFEACLNTVLSPNDVLDTDDLIGRKFRAKLIAKTSGKGFYPDGETIEPF